MSTEYHLRGASAFQPKPTRLPPLQLRKDQARALLEAVNSGALPRVHWLATDPDPEPGCHAPSDAGAVKIAVYDWDPDAVPGQTMRCKGGVDYGCGPSERAMAKVGHGVRVGRKSRWV